MQAKTITVHILTRPSPRKSVPSTVECIVVKSGEHFTLHRSVAYSHDSKRWTITHNATGLALAHCNVLKGARVLHRHVDELITESGIELRTSHDFSSNPLIELGLTQLVAAYRNMTNDIG